MGMLTVLRHALVKLLVTATVVTTGVEFFV